MSASMLGVSFPNPDAYFDDLFQPHHGTRQNHWPLATSHSRIDPFSFGRVGQPYTEDMFSPYQKNGYPVFISPAIEDEETRHGFLSHISGSGSAFSGEMAPTVSKFSDTIQPGNIDSAVEQVHVSSLDGASGVSENQLTSSVQKLHVNTHNHLPAAEVTSSSFNPFAEYGCYSVHPLATHQQSMEYAPVSTMSDESDTLESEQPTDLSMPKNALQNVDGGSTADENSCQNADAFQDSCYGRTESPICQLTYTHLSDVSNDSEEDLDENLKNLQTSTPSFAKKRFEQLVPHQLALPWISTQPIIERANIYMFDLVASFAQMFMDPSAIILYICWLLRNQFLDMIELSHKVPKQKQKIVELKEDSFYVHSDATSSAENMADEHMQPEGEEFEVIHVNPDDDDDDDDDDKSGVGSEQLHVQSPTVCSLSNQQLLAEVPTEVQRAEQNTLPLQKPISPISPLTVPSVSHLESSTLSMDSIMSPEKDTKALLFLSQPSSSRNPCAQQNYYFPLPTLKEQSHSSRDKDMRQHFTDASSTQLLLPGSTTISAAQKRPYRETEAMCEAAQCSGPKQLRRSLRLQSVAKESTCTSVKRNMRPRNHQDRRRPKPADEEVQCMTPTRPQQSPYLEAETRKCAPATRKRSREPWDHKGLLSFVAQNAFKLPRHVWTERKEGEQRKSMRLAKKMQSRRYFLRPRLHTKS
ncbi:uncharacterized protein LOC126457741 [Schistocerca serialis cubense]|uniref:uncharacterized protein LOC126457741 n=1 Tax=Schistocerca serialis cubense TaxID=2023355 RepID=UPI00214E594E|nr:uncharacterized protein LOC126457741 [Schistocerca serialis cubense]